MAICPCSSLFVCSVLVAVVYVHSVSVMYSFKKMGRGASYKHQLHLSLSTHNQQELHSVFLKLLFNTKTIIHLFLSLHLVTESAIKYNASMITTEISQLPFTGVLEILKMAKSAMHMNYIHTLYNFLPYCVINCLSIFIIILALFPLYNTEKQVLSPFWI